MDIALLKTFLELHQTRHFGHAARRLFLTQSAVSARLRQLEDSLGVTLFTRDRNNVHLTPAGLRFLKHAENIVNAWNRAKQETALADDSKDLLSIGGVYSLWDTGLQASINHFHMENREIALRIEAGNQEDLLRKLLEGAIDLGFMFEPPKMAELLSVEFGQIDLIMVSSVEGQSANDAMQRKDYVMVDWGTSFAINHARAYPDIPPPSLHMGLGRLALAFILECGGSAYLTRQMVESQLAAKQLFTVSEAVVIDRQVYAVYIQNSARKSHIESALRHLKTLN